MLSCSRPLSRQTVTRPPPRPALRDPAILDIVTFRPTEFILSRRPPLFHCLFQLFAPRLPRFPPRPRSLVQPHSPVKTTSGALSTERPLYEPRARICQRSTAIMGYVFTQIRGLVFHKLMREHSAFRSSFAGSRSGIRASPSSLPRTESPSSTVYMYALSGHPSLPCGCAPSRRVH